MRLYIAEKPSMAREIAACLKNPKKFNGYIETDGGIVTWLFGHVLQPVKPEGYDAKYKIWRAEDLPIVPKIWKLEVEPKAAEQFNIVKNLIRKADEIVHAGDPDREGQLLVDEVLDFLGNKKPVKRILLNALDKASIVYAIEHLDDNKNFFNLKQSALARSRADWLIGMNLSRAYTLAAQRSGYRDVFPIGRVKTPTLALVVRREKEIQNFTPKDFYKIYAQFQHVNGIFTAIWKPNEDFIKSINPTAIDSEGRLVNKKAVAYFLKKFSEMPHDATITNFESAKRKESPPLPFALSNLQISAGKLFGYSPQQVLDAAQSLYEKKFTTYPRSDCQYLPLNQFDAAKKILAHLANTHDEILKRLVENADAQIKSRAWNNSKISAHHAIIPTVKPFDGNATQIEINVYNLIAKNFAVQFHQLHLYDECIVTVTYKDEIFSARSKMVTQNGWRDFYVMLKNISDDEVENTLPKMQKGDNVTYENAEVKINTTQKPVRFTASTLVQGMKEIHKFVKDNELRKKLKDVYGIGTEATRAAIINDLITRKFLILGRDKKKSLQPTEKAFLLIDALPDALTYPDATAIWEEKLYLMSDGQGTLEDFLKGQAKFTGELCADAINAKFKLPEGSYKCPRCKVGVMVQRNGKNGTFWGCSKYPACKMTCNDKNGKPDFFN